MKKVFLSSEKSTAPLSGAVEVNGFLYVSGQIHIDKEGNVRGETIKERFDLTISNIQRILEEADLTLKDVIRVQLYLTDIGELPTLNQVYGKYFQHPFPARTAIGVQTLPLGASLEIDIIAHRE